MPFGSICLLTFPEIKGVVIYSSNNPAIMYLNFRNNFLLNKNKEKQKSVK